MDSGRPIRPEEMPAAKRIAIHPRIFDVWNTVIAEAYTKGRAHVPLATILNALAKATGESKGTIVASKWLDIEDAYRAAGWKVTYDSPAYYESYEPSFTFTKQ